MRSDSAAGSRGSATGAGFVQAHANPARPIDAATTSRTRARLPDRLFEFSRIGAFIRAILREGPRAVNLAASRVGPAANPFVPCLARPRVHEF